VREQGEERLVPERVAVDLRGPLPGIGLRGLPAERHDHEAEATGRHFTSFGRMNERVGIPWTRSFPWLVATGSVHRGTNARREPASRRRPPSPTRAVSGYRPFQWTPASGRPSARDEEKSWRRSARTLPASVGWSAPGRATGHA